MSNSDFGSIRVSCLFGDKNRKHVIQLMQDRVPLWLRQAKCYRRGYIWNQTSDIRRKLVLTVVNFPIRRWHLWPNDREMLADTIKCRLQLCLTWSIWLKRVSFFLPFFLSFCVGFPRSLLWLVRFVRLFLLPPCLSVCLSVSKSSPKMSEQTTT